MQALRPEKVWLEGLMVLKYYAEHEAGKLPCSKRRLQTAHLLGLINQVIFLSEIRDAMFIIYQDHTLKKHSLPNNY